MTLLAEIELLKRARTVLRSGDAAQAIELLTRHARERTGNGLEAEATLLRIEALAALGQHADASELATRFVHENPNSALGDRAKRFIRATPPRP
jgi:outer membrane protein assembly factor BamD (BamD/ComL family)